MECKKVLEKVEELLFIEEHSTKGFCSESCIEEFYSPLIVHYENLERQTREKLGLANESIPVDQNDKDIVEAILESPSEVWQIENEMNESLFTYIRHYGDYSAVVICTLYNKQASFIFFKTTTKSKELLAEFRPSKGENIRERPETIDELEFSEEDFQFMQLLENKKSKLLADLLMKRKESDISFEEFSNFENCFQDCLDTPDEVFETKDNEGDVFFVYIKSFLQNSQNFFYIISTLKRKDAEKDNEVSVFPVLAFPTNDIDLYKEFRVGSRISAPLRN
jgi:hypothetical protein